MSRYQLTEKYFDGLRMHEAGAEIEYDGSPAPYMVPVEKDDGGTATMRAELDAVNQERQGLAAKLRVAQLRAKRGDQTAAKEAADLAKQLQEHGELAGELQKAIADNQRQFIEKARAERERQIGSVRAALAANGAEIDKIAGRLRKNVDAVAADLRKLQQLCDASHRLLGGVLSVETLLDTAHDPHALAQAVACGILLRAGFTIDVIAPLSGGGFSAMGRSDPGLLAEAYIELLVSRLPADELDPLPEVMDESTEAP